MYSTCSLEPEENQAVVEEVLASNQPYRLLDCREELGSLQSTGDLTLSDIGSVVSGPYLRTIPGLHPCDGFFAAIIEQKS